MVRDSSEALINILAGRDLQWQFPKQTPEEELKQLDVPMQTDEEDPIPLDIVYPHSKIASSSRGTNIRGQAHYGLRSLGPIHKEVVVVKKPYSLVKVTNAVLGLRAPKAKVGCLGLLFHGGLTTTWDFTGFRPVFKDTERNAVTMSEYLRFPFRSGASISKGPPLTSQDRIEQHTTRPLSSDQPIPKKTDHQKEVEVEDPKIVAIRERKAKAAAKKKNEKKRHGNDGGEGSRPKTKRMKTVARKGGPATFEATSSPKPIRIVNPNQANPSNVVAATAESREQRSPRDSVSHSVHNYSGQHDDERTDTLRLGTSGGQSGRVLVDTTTEVILMRVSPLGGVLFMCPTGLSTEDVAWILRNGAVNLWSTWRLRPLKKSPMRSTTPLPLSELSFLWPGEPWLRLTFLKDSNNFKIVLTSWPERMSDVRIRLVNNEQSLRIKELEDLLAKKDSALVYDERINSERAQEKEKLVTQLGKTEMEKFDSIRKLRPTVVECLFQSHEYKRSLSEPFNLAIQAGWGKGLTEERSEEDLAELIGRMKGFDAYADTKMKVEYDTLFEKRYPYVKKISRGFRHSISDLLKVYPGSPPPSRILPANIPLARIPRLLLLTNRRLFCMICVLYAFELLM
ncbi:hypothetical protein Tco_1326569 [Tanacetum coccineum]